MKRRSFFPMLVAAVAAPFVPLITLAAKPSQPWQHFVTSNTTLPQYEVQESRHFPGEWVVEMIDHASEGECYAALFSGPGARQRAEEYAAWKNL